MVLLVFGSSRGGASLWVGLPVVASGLLLLGLILSSVLRRATIAGQDALVLQGLFGAKQVQWSRVQAIKVESPLAPARRGPQAQVVVYDDAGNRLELPQLDDKNIADLGHEASALAKMWGQRRGPQWQPAPAVVRARVQQQDRVQRIFAFGLIAGMSTLLLTLIVLVVLLLTRPAGGHDGFLSVVDQGWLILAAPPVAAAVTAVAVWLHQRRSQGVVR